MAPFRRRMVIAATLDTRPGANGARRTPPFRVGQRGDQHRGRHRAEGRHHTLIEPARSSPTPRKARVSGRASTPSTAHLSLRRRRATRRPSALAAGVHRAAQKFASCLPIFRTSRKDRGRHLCRTSHTAYALIPLTHDDKRRPVERVRWSVGGHHGEWARRSASSPIVVKHFHRREIGALRLRLDDVVGQVEAGDADV